MLRVGRLSHIKVYCVLLFDGQLVGKDSVRLRPKHPFFFVLYDISTGSCKDTTRDEDNHSKLFPLCSQPLWWLPKSF